ncbi:acetylglutamate kinase [Ignavibacteria bacterium]|nr:acetylglutamate kinase [Bacteroidota bacterium]MCZ2133234.1 acetylglutamate kinase [Bacteroidota bacterium]
MITVVKIGGNIIDRLTDDEAVLQRFVSSLKRLSPPFVIVHGGGKIASELGKRLGIVPNIISGRRVTDAETLKIVVMTYAGLINKSIVALLQANGIDSIGITGADANAIMADKRPATDIDYGFVGDISNVKTDFLDICFSAGITPVIAPITHNGKGLLLNTNADSVAAATALALARQHQVTLIYCFEKEGVLADSRNDSSVIDNLNQELYAKLAASGAISDGMSPKLENAFSAKRGGVQNVFICHADAIENPASGTTIHL